MPIPHDKVAADLEFIHYISIKRVDHPRAKVVLITSLYWASNYQHTIIIVHKYVKELAFEGFFVTVICCQ